MGSSLCEGQGFVPKKAHRPKCRSPLRTKEEFSGASYEVFGDRQQKERITKDVRYQESRGVTFDCEFTTHDQRSLLFYGTSGKNAACILWRAVIICFGAFPLDNSVQTLYT